MTHPNPDPLTITPPDPAPLRRGIAWGLVLEVVATAVLFALVVAFLAPRAAATSEAPHLRAAPYAVEKSGGSSVIPGGASPQPAPVNVTGSVGTVPATPTPAAISALSGTATGIGSPLTTHTDVAGTASHVGTQFGRLYLALPEHRWGKPGITVKICGAGGCVTRTSTDAGPDKAMQRAGRVADLNAWDFTTVCGCPASTGLTAVTVEYLRDPPKKLPDTSTAP